MDDAEYVMGGGKDGMNAIEIKNLGKNTQDFV